MKKQGLAVFDLDGTITHKDTFLEFIRFVHGSVKLYVGLLLHLPYIGLFYLKQYPNNRLKEKIFTHFFKGYSIERLTDLGRIFSQEIMPKFCYPKAIERLEWHQKQGHDSVILTASAGIWLQEWCRIYQLDLIATIYETKQGRYTGNIQGKNCYGLEKVKRLQQQFNLNDFALTYGYGDTSADQYFLALMEQSYYKYFE